MFAGAVREAVLSNPDVIRRINADFVPVALKAALVNRPPDDEEGLLYREIEAELLPLCRDQGVGERQGSDGNRQVHVSARGHSRRCGWRRTPARRCTT